MAYFCVNDTGRCFPRVNGNQFPTPVSIKNQPDVRASNGGSQEEKRVEEDSKVKRKRTSLKGDVQACPLKKFARRRGRCIRQNTGESSQKELNSGSKTGMEGDDQVIEQQFSEEQEVDREFSALREEEDKVNEKKDTLLRDYDGYFRTIVQVLQDAYQSEKLGSRLTDVRHDSAELTPKTKNVETRLKDLRLAAKDKYCSVVKAEKERRLKTEAELQSEKGRHSKLDADLKSEKAKSAKLEAEVQFEKTRRQSESLEKSLLQADLQSERTFEKTRRQSESLEKSLLQADLQSERTKREKLESDLKSEETKRLNLEEGVMSDYTRRMKLEAEARSHEAERVKVQEEMQLERAKRLKVEEDIQSEKEKRLKLEEDFRLSEQKMESERSKLVCQICLEAIRDTMILPCTHFLYCNRCLVRHKCRSNTCPTCRGSMTALLHCHLGVS